MGVQAAQVMDAAETVKPGWVSVKFGAYIPQVEEELRGGQLA